jgi:hypothetical protein
VVSDAAVLLVCSRAALRDAAAAAKAAAAAAAEAAAAAPPDASAAAAPQCLPLTPEHVAAAAAALRHSSGLQVCGQQAACEPSSFHAGRLLHDMGMWR